MANEGLRFEIAYYTGTGGSALVAGCFEKILNEAGCNGETHLVSVQPENPIKHDILFLIFPVHASNAPEAVYRWLEQIPTVNQMLAVVISVSGGGEIIPNTASRVSSIKRLERKGYNVVYEDMIVMPSNWIVGTHELLAIRLLEVLPQKVNNIVGEVLLGKKHRTKPRLIDYFLSFVGEFEKPFTKYFGKHIKSLDSCVGCGWCAKHCPAENIRIVERQALFDDKCHLCLGCIYGCPEEALVATKYKFILVKEGYDLAKLQSKVPLVEPIDVGELAKGYLWSGVKKYLDPSLRSG